MVLVTPVIMFKRHVKRSESEDRNKSEDRKMDSQKEIKRKTVTQTETQKDTPLVSVLRPLKGLDTNLETNLESTFTQDYPNLELLFCLESETDPAFKVVEKLMEKYPKIDCKIILGICC
jgi:ceramide glucosyltransferase